MRPETGQVPTWIDSSNPRGMTLTGCDIVDAANWSCPLRSTGQTRGRRDGVLYREPFDGTRYVGWASWFWHLLAPAGNRA